MSQPKLIIKLAVLWSNVKLHNLNFMFVLSKHHVYGRHSVRNTTMQVLCVEWMLQTQVQTFCFKALVRSLEPSRTVETDPLRAGFGPRQVCFHSFHDHSVRQMTSQKDACLKVFSSSVSDFSLLPSNAVAQTDTRFPLGSAEVTLLSQLHVDAALLFVLIGDEVLCECLQLQLQCFYKDTLVLCVIPETLINARWAEKCNIWHLLRLLHRSKLLSFMLKQLFSSSGMRAMKVVRPKGKFPQQIWYLHATAL